MWSKVPSPISVYGIRRYGPEKWEVSQTSSWKNCQKCEDEHSKVANYRRCKGAFIVLRSELLCLRGSRTVRKEKMVAVAEDIDLGNDKLLLQVDDVQKINIGCEKRMYKEKVKVNYTLYFILSYDIVVYIFFSKKYFTHNSRLFYQWGMSSTIFLGFRKFGEFHAIDLAFNKVHLGFILCSNIMHFNKKIKVTWH